ncbi:MAG: endolytic transglycosylase MltG [Candidatus Paceibacterota bacterium]|jgi:UPF0755 protein
MMDYFSANKVFFYVLGATTLLAVFYYFLFSAPANFPVGVIIKIDQGESLRSVSFQFKKDNIIRSRIAFEAFVILFGGEKHIIPADYFFEGRLPVFEIAGRISRGERHLAPVKVTIPEGLNVSEMAQIFTTKLSNFDSEKFLQSAKDLEGYLFPDTYFFFTTANEQDVLKSMSENFNKKIELVRPDIISLSKTKGRTEREIIIMASLVEGEAKGEFDRGFISGILWKRLSMDMPLQVDVAMETYKKKGLPANPVVSPGLKAIKAAIYPQNSPYLYYIHDTDGNIHYAKSFVEHRRNIERYLR